MATRINNARDHRRVVARTIEAVPYAGRQAGLYSEVSWPSVPGPSPRAEQSPGDDEHAGPRV